MPHDNRKSIRPSVCGASGIKVTHQLFRTQINQLVSETTSSLETIWDEAGYEDIECQGILGDLLEKLKKVCDTEISAERQILEHAKHEVVGKTELYRTHCEQLGRSCDVSEVPGNNYADKLAELEKLISSISVEVEERQGILDIELNRIKDIMTEMGTEIEGAEIFQCPSNTFAFSDARLQQLREHKNLLEKERKLRIESIKMVMRQVCEVMQDLVEDCSELAGTCDAHDKTGEWVCGVHTENLSAYEAKLESLTEEREKRRDELSSTGAEIARLWTLLRVPTAEREAFQGSFQMNLSSDTLEKGRNELQRLHRIRTQSLTEVIANIRADIVAYWEELGITQKAQQEDAFPAYFSAPEDLQDSSVEEHESYCLQLKARIEELRPLLQKISKRETVVEERIQLEHLQMNPERLTARGPNAREERKREEAMTYHVRGLEKLTREILAGIAAWEEANGPFLYAGERYSERLGQQEAEYAEIRDGLRAARNQKKQAGKGDSGGMPTNCPVPPRGAHGHSASGRKGLGGSANPKPRSAAASTFLAHNHNSKPAGSNAKRAVGAGLGRGDDAENRDDNLPADTSGQADGLTAGKLHLHGLSAPYANMNRESDCTQYTSVTEVRERESCGTFVQEDGSVDVDAEEFAQV